MEEESEVGEKPEGGIVSHQRLWRCGWRNEPWSRGLQSGEKETFLELKRGQRPLVVQRPDYRAKKISETAKEIFRGSEF